jgi:hypothetical protein
MKGGCLLGCCTISTTETSTSVYQTTRRNIPEDSHLHTLLCENKCHLSNNRTVLHPLYRANALYNVLNTQQVYWSCSSSGYLLRQQKQTIQRPSLLISILTPWNNFLASLFPWLRWSQCLESGPRFRIRNSVNKLVVRVVVYRSSPVCSWCRGGERALSRPKLRIPATT